MKIYNLLKKYKIAIFIVLGFIIIGILIIIIFLNSNKQSNLHEFNNNYYSITYDDSWKILSSKDDLIEFNYNNKANIIVNIVNLESNYSYITISDMLDNLLYDIQKENQDYKLISKVEDKITKNGYNGYKILFEKDQNQVMVVMVKKENKLILFTYEAPFDYFDILLDSVQNIIYDFEIIEPKFELASELNLKTTAIKFNESNEITALLNDKLQYEIANNHYKVVYSIPDNFKSSVVNSAWGNFDFIGLDKGSLDLSASIYNTNIYEYLDKSDITSVFNEWNTYKDDEKYSEFTENFDKLDSNYESYIYKNSYYYNNDLSFDENFNAIYKKRIEENVVLIYPLDKSHIFTIKISSSGLSIPKDLIDRISLDSFKNYSSYLSSTKENGYIISKLKREKSYLSEDTENVILKISDKYKEIDKQSNIYEHRYYVLNYNENLDIYDYEVNYSLTSEYGNIETILKGINSFFLTENGNYEYLKYVGLQEINGKQFQIYEGGFTDISTSVIYSRDETYYVNVKLLLYELPTGGFLTIEVRGNGKQIDDNIVNDITNFEINNF